MDSKNHSTVRSPGSGDIHQIPETQETEEDIEGLMTTQELIELYNCVHYHLRMSVLTDICLKGIRHRKCSSTASH